MSTDELLGVESLTVRFDTEPILFDVDLNVAAGSIVAVVGAGGGGKSTLLRAIAGRLDDHPTATLEGRVDYRGSASSPHLVVQKPGKAMESVYDYLADADPDRSQKTGAELKSELQGQLRDWNLEAPAGALDNPVVSFDAATRARLRVLRAVVGRSELICLDEPFEALEADRRRVLAEMLGQCRARGHSLLVVTHHLDIATRIADDVAVMCSGQIVEHRSASEFFDTPDTDCGRQLLESGSCSYSSAESTLRPNDRLDECPDDADTEDSSHYRHPGEVRGPRGFRWLLAGRLGTSPRPGVVEPIERDLAALERIGTTLLFSLTEEPLDPASLDDVGFETRHVPIPDTRAPGLEEAAETCEIAARWMDHGASVVFHCHAGRGRAGTMAAAMLVWAGHTGDCALQWVRQVNDKWIQTAEQEQFLDDFHQWLADNQPRRPHRRLVGDPAPYCSCPQQD